ncbi:hypothetical protein FRC11_012485, partial [Ceratobasidium sp. 423]
METPGRDSTPLPVPASDAATIELRQKIIDETRKRTNGKTPNEWQIQNTLDRLAGNGTFIIAGTGAGKSLTFAIVPFMVPKSISWILAPLNYIEEQLVKYMEGWGVRAIAINQNSNWEEEKRKILNGEYQVVISSPEAFLSLDRLRNVAHVIHTWGGSFRKDYGRVGNLRGMMFDIPFSTATATATPTIKKSIIDCLHLGKQRELAEINLGNFRSNIEYSIYLMKDGSESYEELLQLLPDRDPDRDNLRPKIIFVDKTHDTHAITTLLRDHLGITGTPKWDLVRPYHANRAQSGGGGIGTKQGGEREKWDQNVMEWGGVGLVTLGALYDGRTKDAGKLKCHTFAGAVEEEHRQELGVGIEAVSTKDGN